jgi:hypothetical protein
VLFSADGRQIFTNSGDNVIGVPWTLGACGSRKKNGSDLS